MARGSWNWVKQTVLNPDLSEKSEERAKAEERGKVYLDALPTLEVAMKLMVNFERKDKVGTGPQQGCSSLGRTSVRTPDWVVLELELEARWESGGVRMKLSEGREDMFGPRMDVDIN